MKHFVDGDYVVVTLDDFVDLQESPAVFIPKDSEDGQKLLLDGIRMLSIGSIERIFNELQRKAGKVG